MMKKGGGDHQMQHHMMASMMNAGVSPVTIVINPGVMPIMESKMGHHKGKGGSMSGDNKIDEKQKHKMMAMEKMQNIERRLEKIETLLGKLLDQQAQD